jgi:hypothetical protein
MINKRLLSLVSVFYIVVSSGVLAKDSDFLGEWLVTMQEPAFEAGEKEVPLYEKTGTLTVTNTQKGIQGFVDGGSAPLSIADNKISIELDWTDIYDRRHISILEGTLNKGIIKGTFRKTPDDDWLNWRASRIVEDKTSQSDRPVDFTGIWEYRTEGLAKATFIETPAARKVIKNYKELDDNVSRCASPGLARITTWPFPIEIFQNEKQLTILYEGLHEVRRIYLDGRSFPKNGVETAMGYSIGHWEGSTLVVDTRLLKGLYLNASGRPLSENTHIVERMSLSSNGKILSSNMTIRDPEHYRLPVKFNRTFTLNNSIEMGDYDCDAHSFYRGMSIDGTLDEYWKRAEHRR